MVSGVSERASDNDPRWFVLITGLVYPAVPGTFIDGFYSNRESLKTHGLLPVAIVLIVHFTLDYLYTVRAVATNYRSSSCSFFQGVLDLGIVACMF